LAKDPDKLLSEVEENLKFLSLLGVEFVTRESSGLSLEEIILNCQKCPLATTADKDNPCHEVSKG